MGPAAIGVAFQTRMTGPAPRAGMPGGASGSSTRVERAVATTAPPPAGATQPMLLAKRYRLDRRLAHGGMSEVWVATDTILDRQVAVKLLKASLADDPVVVERFRREAVAAAGLNHPYIVSIYDTVEDRGREAVVMELVPGRSLRGLLDRSRPHSASTRRSVIGRAVAAALDHAHQSGLVHRDVKPGNVLVTPEGRVKLTDFGIAKAVESRHDDLTAENVMMGTAKYLSPEQVLGFPLDGRADLYSLGLVLYECLTGKVPFTGATDGAIAIARLQRDPTPIRRSPGRRCPQPVADAVDPAPGPAARGPPGHGRSGPRHADRRRRRTRRRHPAAGLAAATERTAGRRRLHPGQRRGRALEAGGGPGPAVRGRTRWRWPAWPRSARSAAGAVAFATHGDGDEQPHRPAPTVVTGAGQVGSVPATIGPLGSPQPGPGLDHRSSESSTRHRATARRTRPACAALTDGNPATAWTTVCYESKYLYPKSGRRSRARPRRSGHAASACACTWPTGPWRVAVYTAERPGAALADLGTPGGQPGQRRSGRGRARRSATPTGATCWCG